MTAETLRRAAALMRERATNARAGVWTALPSVLEPDATLVLAEWEHDRRRVATASGSLPDGNAANATHIASWHPAVAFAVADWLTVVADRYDALLDTFAPGSRAGAVTAAENVTGWQEALAVAQAYLGEIQSIRPERGAE